MLLPGGPGLHGVAGAQCAEQELMLVRQVGHAGVGRAELGDEQAQLGADLIEGAQQPHRAGGGEYGPMEGHVVVGDHVPQVRSFTAEDAIDLYRVRRPIETVAVDLMLSQARPVAGVDTALQQFTALGDDVSCSTSVAVAGMCLVVLPGAHDPSSWLGILLATLAAAYAWQAHAIHQLSHRHRPLETVAVLFSGAALLLAPLSVSGIGVLTATPQAITGVLYLGLFTTAIAYGLFAFGVPHTGAPTAVTLTLLEPVAAPALAALIAHQVPSIIQAIGIATTLAALGWLAGRPSDRTPADRTRLARTSPRLPAAPSSDPHAAPHVAPRSPMNDRDLSHRSVLTGAPIASRTTARASSAVGPSGRAMPQKCRHSGPSGSCGWRALSSRTTR